MFSFLFVHWFVWLVLRAFVSKLYGFFVLFFCLLFRVLCFSCFVRSLLCLFQLAGMPSCFDFRFVRTLSVAHSCISIDFDWTITVVFLCMNIISNHWWCRMLLCTFSYVFRLSYADELNCVITHWVSSWIIILVNWWFDYFFLNN